MLSNNDFKNILSGGGATFVWNGNMINAPTILEADTVGGEVWIVGGVVPELVVSDELILFRDGLVAFMEDNAASFIDDRCLGVWHNKHTGYIHLDISEVVDNKIEAINRGKVRGELAIFDLKNMKEVLL